MTLCLFKVTSTILGCGCLHVTLDDLTLLQSCDPAVKIVDLLFLGHLKSRRITDLDEFVLSV
jgi:hypothetical protein